MKQINFKLIKYLLTAVFILGFFLYSTDSLAYQLDLSSSQSKEREYYVIPAREVLEDFRNLKEFTSEYYLQEIGDSKYTNRWLRLLYYAPLFYINFKLAEAGATVIHEVGHAEKAYFYYDNASLGIGDNIGLSIFDLYFRRTASNKRAYTSYFIDMNNTSTKIESEIIGAGINANTVYAKILNEKYLYKERYNIFSSMNYIYNKITGLVYFASSMKGNDPAGDPNKYVGYLSDMGIETNVEQILYLKIIATIFSGGVINSALTNINKLNIEPLSFMANDIKIFIPEHSVYLNSDNISYAANLYVKSSPYDNAFYYILGLEDAVIGNSTPMEMTLGIRQNNWDYSFDFQTMLNTKLNYFLKTKISRKILDNLDVYAMFWYGDNQTLSQKRELVYAKDFFSLGFKYSF